MDKLLLPSASRPSNKEADVTPRTEDAEQCSLSEQEDEEVVPNTGAEAERTTAKSRRARQAQRPCKSKRLRFKNLTDKLEAKVHEDPYNFVLDDTELPPSVLANPGFLMKLKERLAALSETLRAEGGAAAASSQEQPGRSMKMSL